MSVCGNNCSSNGGEPNSTQLNYEPWWRWKVRGLLCLVLRGCGGGGGGRDTGVVVLHHYTEVSRVCRLDRLTGLPLLVGQLNTGAMMVTQRGSETQSHIIVATKQHTHHMVGQEATRMHWHAHKCARTHACTHARAADTLTHTCGHMHTHMNSIVGQKDTYTHTHTHAYTYSYTHTHNGTMTGKAQNKQLFMLPFDCRSARSLRHIWKPLVHFHLFICLDIIAIFSAVRQVFLINNVSVGLSACHGYQLKGLSVQLVKVPDSFTQVIYW